MLVKFREELTRPLQEAMEFMRRVESQLSSLSISGRSLRNILSSGIEISSLRAALSESVACSCSSLLFVFLPAVLVLLERMLLICVLKKEQKCCDLPAVWHLHSCLFKSILLRMHV
jgi:hypothetical protein